MLIEIKRAYGGQEGKRVRVGQQFWVAAPGSKKAPDGLVVITFSRWKQLEAARLAAKVEGDSAPAAPRPARSSPTPTRTPTPAPRSKVEPDSNAPKQPGARALSKAKEPAPQSPRPGGPKDGKDATSSSSQAAPQIGKSGLKQRGTRRGTGSGGSSSTTPTSSAPGQTSSTPATPNGGDSTTGSDDSAAFA